MEAFLAQLAAAARKASDQRYCKQGRPPVQQKSAAAGRPVKKEGVRQRSPSAPARNRARNSHQEPNTHKHKTLDWQAAPNSAIPEIDPLGLLHRLQPEGSLLCSSSVLEPFDLHLVPLECHSDP